MTEWFGGKFPEGVLIAEWFNPKLSIEEGFNIDFFRGGSLISRGHGGDPNKSVYFDKAGQGTVKDGMKHFRINMITLLKKDICRHLPAPTTATG